ncbi:MAG: hypothetical protein O2995_12800 [Proteobacteria bacterium]|nr:hypothetical protein [Pseudomonadota bacterium]
MPDKKMEPQDISRLAESIHDMPISETRAVALAAEVNQLNLTVQTQSRGLAYDVDAFGFSGALQKLKRLRR